MAATEITITSHLYGNAKTFDRGARLHYTGSGGPYDTTGGGTYDDIAYFNAVGITNCIIRINELISEAGTLRIYGSAVSTTPDPTGSGVLANGAFEKIGSDVAIGSGVSVVTSFTNKYYWIFFSFAKTGAGAGTDNISADILLT